MSSYSIDSYLECYLSRALRGRINDEYTIAEQGLAEILRNPFSTTVLLKLVRLPLALNWIATQFPGLRIIQIIRHPAPQFLSWRHRQWDPGWALRLLLAQQELMNGPLAPFEESMRAADTFWEKAGAFWGAVATIQLQSHREGWYLFEHEWYCSNAENRINWLLEQLGFTWTPEIERFIYEGSGHSSGPGYGKHRDPRAEIHKWEGKLSALELHELENAIKEYQLPFYPSLDPEHSWLSGDVKIP
jgi:hypothetical protein